MPRNHGRIEQKTVLTSDGIVGKSSAIKMTAIKANIKPDKMIVLKSPPIATIKRYL
jgi:hypothetical protein